MPTLLEREAALTLAASYPTQPNAQRKAVLKDLTSDMLLAVLGNSRAMAQARSHVELCEPDERRDLVYAAAHAIGASLSLPLTRGGRFGEFLTHVDQVRDDILRVDRMSVAQLKAA